MKHKSSLMPLLLVATAIVSCSAAQPAIEVSTPVRVPFVVRDEATQDEDLVATRAAMLKELSTADAGQLGKFLAAEFRFSATKDGGRALIRAIVGRHKVPGQTSRTVASVIAKILTEGGAFTTNRGAVPGRREFCAPYVYAAFPARLPRPLHVEAPPWVVVGDAAVHTEPGQGEPIAKLSSELVLTDVVVRPDSLGRLWQDVSIPNVTSGYVRFESLRDPGDWHMCFAQIDGAWRATELDRRPPSGVSGL